ncbi:MAG TPA: stage II sporulation protein R [Peptococcaceae bacterium]|nr:MAG: Stage II sporulation protein required for processing of pro-sigma-E (SpoIIR) [Clostridia bacterium 41_269]HBT20101.1 stage II sporulation protein R [Peptococcaceae bacterium]
MRKKIILCVCLFSVFLFGYLICLGFKPALGGSQDLSRDLIRFHVIANSDLPEDQHLKREVRDAVVEKISSDFRNAESIEKARIIIKEKLKVIEETAKKEIYEHGKRYSVKVEFGYFTFPAKTYGSFSLPEGKYEALRVVIGEGKGENWWCVLFPPLCFVDISSSAAAEHDLTESEDENVQQVYKEENLKPRVEVKFKLLEMFNRTKNFIVEHRIKREKSL